MFRLCSIIMVIFVLCGRNYVYASIVERMYGCSLAEDYRTLVWTAGADGIDPNTNDTVFYQGHTYTGMAYKFGGEDTISQFEAKMAAGQAPRQDAGIDCSALVSYCWDISRVGTFDLSQHHEISYNALDDVKMCDAFVRYIGLNENNHAILIQTPGGTDYYSDCPETVEASGGANKVIERINRTWEDFENEGFGIHCNNAWWSIAVPDPATSWGTNSSPLNSANAGSEQVTLNWDQAPEHNSDTRYKVFWGTSPGVYTGFSSQMEWTSSYTVTGLDPWETYYFAVKVGRDPEASYGWSDYSNELSATTYAAPWLISSNKTITSNMIFQGDVVVQNGATLTVASGVTLSFSSSQLGPNYGGDTSRSELVVEDGGTLTMQSNAVLTSSSNWGGVYQYDGGSVQMTGGSTIEKARIGIHFHGFSHCHGSNQSSKAIIQNCTVDGIRITDSSPNLRYIDINNCYNGITVTGSQSTPFIFYTSIYGSSTNMGLCSYAYAAPDFSESKINTNVVSHKIFMSSSGDMNLINGQNNILDSVTGPDTPPYNIFIGSTCPQITTSNNYWNTPIPLSEKRLITNEDSKLIWNPSFNDYPYSYKIAVALNDDFQRADELYLSGNIQAAYDIYTSILDKSDDPQKRTDAIRGICAISRNNDDSYVEVKSLIENELEQAESRNAVVLASLLGDVMIWDAQYDSAIAHFLNTAKHYEGTSLEVEIYVKVARIYGERLGDKKMAEFFADKARMINPGQPTLLDAYSAAGIAYDPAKYADVFFDAGNEFASFGNISKDTEQSSGILDGVKAYPNPANPFSTISYSISNSAYIKLNVYSVTGQKVATLVDSYIQAGTHSAVFNGSSLASGVYFYRIEMNGISKTGKMLLMK